MKAKLIVIAAIFAISISGCIVCSLQPLYSDNTIVLNNKIEGQWIDDESSLWRIQRAKITKKGLNPDDPATQEIIPQNFYKLEHTDKRGTASYIVYMIKLDGQYYLDFLPDNQELDKVVHNDLMMFHLLPVHTFAKLDITSDSLTVSWFEEDWLEKLFKENKIRIEHQIVSERTVLTAPTEDLQKFVIKYGKNPDAYIGSPTVLKAIK